MKCGCETGKADAIRDRVRQGYAAIARSGGGCGGKSCCGTGEAEGVAKAVGYTDQELAALPEGANMGLSCGNPDPLYKGIRKRLPRGATLGEYVTSLEVGAVKPDRRGAA